MDDERGDGPRFVVALLALVAAGLVTVSVRSAFGTGHGVIAGSLLATVALFVGTVVVFEVGFRIGTDG